MTIFPVLRTRQTLIEVRQTGVLTMVPYKPVIITFVHTWLSHSAQTTLHVRFVRDTTSLLKGACPPSTTTPTLAHARTHARTHATQPKGVHAHTRALWEINLTLPPEVASLPSWPTGVDFPCPSRLGLPSLVLVSADWRLLGF